MMKKEEITIISLGGSLIVSESGIDTNFLCRLRDFILKQVKKGKKFLIVAGGGKTARLYRDAASKIVGKLTPVDLDWIGIHATRLNAQLLRIIFAKFSNHKLIINPRKNVDFSQPIIIGAGWKPGWSTDYVATFLAQKYGVKTVINMTNVQAVFDRDPSKYKDVTPLSKISWEEFRELIGKKWEPGMRAPFDPMASRLAQQNKITVVILDGKNLLNVENFLSGRNFTGTVIE